MKNRLIYKINYLFIFLIISLIISSCEDNSEYVDGNSSNSTILQLSIPSLPEIQVRANVAAGKVDQIEKFDIYIFRGAGTNVPAVEHIQSKAANPPDASGNITLPGIIASGTASPQINTQYQFQNDDRVYIFLNCDLEKNILVGTSATEDYFQSLKLYCPTLKRAPYYGQVTWKNNRDNVFIMRRIVPKVKLVDASQTKNLFTNKVTKLYTLNAPDSTWLFGHSDVYTQNSPSWLPKKFVVSDSQDGLEINMPEYKSSVHSASEGGTTLSNTAFNDQRMAIILEVYDNVTSVKSYYRLDFINKDINEYINIIHGYQYIFQLLKLASTGYPTINEAIIMPASNVDYTVTVDTDDKWSNTTNYNGQYQLNMDKDTIRALAGVNDTLPLLDLQFRYNEDNVGTIDSIKTRQIKLITGKTGDISSSMKMYLKNKITGNIELVPQNTLNLDLVDREMWNFYFTTTNDLATKSDVKVIISVGSITRTIPVVIMNNPSKLESTLYGTSNCYITSSYNGAFSFPANVMGNGAKGIIDNAGFKNASDATLTKTGGAAITPSSARLIWQDTKDLISQVVLRDNRVEFIKSKKVGNAVIAVYDKANPYDANAKILWSWHVWCTDTPELFYLSRNTTIFPDYSRQYYMMDRNLGATSQSSYSTDTQSQALGLNYEWGRKDPMPGLQTIGVNTQKNVYNIHNDALTLKNIQLSSIAGGIAYSIQNPILYIQGINNNGTTGTVEYLTSWIKNDDIAATTGKLWGSNLRTSTNDTYSTTGQKTIYDPCPPGYVVPQSDIIYTFYINNLTTNIEKYTNVYLKSSSDYTIGYNLYYNRRLDTSNIGYTYFPLNSGMNGHGVFPNLNGTILHSAEMGIVSSVARPWSLNIGFQFGASTTTGPDVKLNNTNGTANAAPVRCVREL